VLVATPPTSSASPSGSLLGAPPSGLSKGGGLGWGGGLVGADRTPLL
jgi:hypothetical protein